MQTQLKLLFSVSGVDPKEHPINKENERLKALMSRYQIICAQRKRQRLNVDAAGRFIRNSLWTPPAVSAVPISTDSNNSSNTNMQPGESWDDEMETDDTNVSESTDGPSTNVLESTESPSTNVLETTESPSTNVLKSTSGSNANVI